MGLVDILTELIDSAAYAFYQKVDKLMEEVYIRNIIKKHGFPQAIYELIKCAQYRPALLKPIRRVLAKGYPKQLDAFNNALLLM